MTGAANGRRPLATAAVLGSLVFAYALLLSHWLHVTPDGLMWNRSNVLFDADTAAVGRVLLGEQEPQFPRRHPLGRQLWVPVVAGLERALRVFFPLPWSSVLAVRVLLGALVAFGYGLLAAAALLRGANLGGVLAVLGVSLAATSMGVIVVPEFYGLSHGVLAIASGVTLWPWPLGRRIGVLLLLSVVAGGTTVTNALFPLGLAAALLLSRVTVPARFRRQLPRLIAAACALGIISGIVLALGPLRGPLARTRAGIGVGKSTHYRLITNPSEAARFAWNGIVFPLVGPAPANADTNRVSLTYNPRSMLDLSALQAIAALAWLALLGLATVRAMRVPEDRPLVVVLLGWVLGNLFVHNLWGYELMLYSPHWSVALLAVLWLGATTMAPRAVLTLAAVIMAGQIQTLVQVIRALETA